MKKNRITALIISLSLVLIVVLGAVSAYAKYIMKSGKQSELVSDNFYFTSDYLKADETPTYTHSGNSVTFQARNYIDGLRINQADISYTVTVETAGEGINLSQSGGTLAGGAQKADNITLSYEFQSGETQKEITVSLSSTQPYAKTLRATFLLIKTNLKYEIQDAAGEYSAELYLHMGNSSQTVTLVWDNTKLSIDRASDYVFGKTITTTGNESSLALDGIPMDSTVKIVFFKHDINVSYACAPTGSDGNIRISQTTTI